MNLNQILEQLQLTVLTEPKSFASIPVVSAYTSDLLSCVMASAKPGSVWITLQAHMNVIAVATLLDISAVILTESAQPDPAVLQKANEQGITLLSSPESSFTIGGQLWQLGLRAP